MDIEWWKTPNGKLIPIDYRSDGKIIPHWQTCPDAADFKKDKEEPKKPITTGATFTLTDQQMLDDLAGTKCRGCGGTKGRRMSHCRACYFKLPKKMRNDLYKRFDSGYQEAYIESLKFLNARRVA